MSMLQVLPVIGLPQVDGWSHVIEERKDNVTLVVSFSVSGPNARNVGRDLVEYINKQTIVSSQELYAVLNSLREQSYVLQCSLDLSCALFMHDKIALAALRGSIYLRRKTKSGMLLKADHRLKLIEGKYQKHDLYMIGTEQGSRFFEEVELRLDQGFDVQSAVSSVTQAVQNYEDSSLSALSLVYSDGPVEEKAHSQQMIGLQKKDADIKTYSRSANYADLAAARIDSLSQQENELDEEVEIPEYIPTQLLKKEAIYRTPINLDEGLTEDSSVTHPQSVNDTSKKAAANLLDIPIAEQKNESNMTPKLDLGKIISGVSRSVTTGFAGIVAMVRSVKSKKKVSNPSSEIKPATQSDFTFPAQDDFFDQEHSSDIKSKKQWKKVLGILLIIAFLGGAGFGIWYLQQQDQRKQALTKLEPYSQSLLTIHAQAQQNPIGVRTELVSLIQQLESVQKEFEGQKIASAEVAFKLSEARALLIAISGRQELIELPVFYDLRLATSNFIASFATATDQLAIFYDDGLGQIIILNLLSKEAKTIKTSNLTNVKDIAADDNSLFFLSDEGVSKVSLTGEEASVTQVIEANDETNQGSIITAFSNFLYILNPQKRAIYRFTGTNNEFAKPTQWLQSPLGLPFESVISVAIDGDVWIGSNDGIIKKFTSGQEQAFSVTNIPEPLTTLTQLVTSEADQNLYVLDSSQNRILVLSKEGQFLREYKSISLGGVSNIVVSESNQKIYALSGSSMYEISL